MKVLHLISSAGMYGAEVMLLNLTRSLAANNCEIVVGVFQNRQNRKPELAEQLKSEGIPVELIPCDGQVDLTAIRRISHLTIARRINLVHSHGYKADVYSFLASRFSSTPIVATAHNWTGKSEGPSIYNKLDRLVLRWFCRVAAVSDGVARKLLDSGVRSHKIVRIPNGVDLAGFEASTPMDREVRSGSVAVVGVVGRLVKEKGCDSFLRAAADVLPHFPGTKFLFIGDGPERNSLELLARDLSIQEKVIFLGHSSDMPRIYASLDFCVLPSLLEGMPMTILEAMAAGKPIIATRVGEIPNMLDTDVNGLLVAPGSVAELSAAMIRLLGDPSLRSRLGENGRRKAFESFSAEVMARAYIALYDEILDDQQGPVRVTLEKV
jgi:glycosyltransferase involved in cell wall biosynthesis